RLGIPGPHGRLLHTFLSPPLVEESSLPTNDAQCRVTLSRLSIEICFFRWISVAVEKASVKEG
ncbi:hypothetical protein KAU05_01880, partial [Candidatus Aerophobetes bacterium]|nr:hypothetical protein [Candidatus Aerophobetes bacterium]